MNIDRAWIAAHIPHQGSMCLLDHVVSWDKERMRAIATSHTAADNPLRAHGRLGAATAIEYAAQTMAVHSALLANAELGFEDKRPQAGFLASVRSATLHVIRLDDLNEALQIEVACTHSAPDCILYQFKVCGHDTQQPVADGRATIVIDAGMTDNNGTRTP